MKATHKITQREQNMITASENLSIQQCKMKRLIHRNIKLQIQEAMGIFLTLIVIVPAPLFADADTYKEPVDSISFAEQQAHLIEIFQEKKNKYNNFLNNLFILGDSSECISSLNETGDCLLDIAEFNADMKSYVDMSWDHVLNRMDTSRATPDFDIDSVRSRIFYSNMVEHYERTEQKKSEQREEHQKKLNGVMDSIVTRAINKGDDSKLQALYSEYYDELYAEVEDSTYLFLLSTDSLFLDSLTNVVKTDKKLILPEFSYNALPSPAQKVADTLSYNRWSSIHKCDLGYFSLISNGSTLIKEEVSYREALPQLINFSPKATFRCKVELEDIWSYYEENEESFLTPDTMDLVIHSVPKIFLTGEKPLSFDVKNRHSRSISSLDLSIKDRESISNSLDWQKDSAAISLSLEYGDYFVKVTDIRSGGKLIPFKVVKDSIKNTLCDSINNRDQLAMYKIFEQKKSDKSYEIFSRRFRKSLEPSKKEAERLFKNQFSSSAPDDGYQLSEDALAHKYVNNKILDNTKIWIKGNVSVSQQLYMIDSY